MDNLTHSLVGLALSKAGLERLSPYATAVCILGANAPDADVVTLIVGRWFYLQHHRGITHSIIGIFVLALALPLLFWLADGAIAAWRKREPKAKLGGLLLASAIATASHPIMDWTNNYGVRPFLPFNSKWFYGDIVFIMDPWLWLALGGACFLLTTTRRKRTLLKPLFRRLRFGQGLSLKAKFRVAMRVFGRLNKRLIWLIIGVITTLMMFLFADASRGVNVPLLSKILWTFAIITIIALYYLGAARLWGNKIALGALAFMVLYWGGLSFAHAQAVNKALTEAGTIAAKNGENVVRIAAMPTVANPTRWQAVAETERAVYRFDSSLTNKNPENEIRYEKPTGQNTEFVNKASQDANAKVFLDFARFPVTKIEGDCFTEVLVLFADLRYTEPTRKSNAGTFTINVPVDCKR